MDKISSKIKVKQQLTIADSALNKAQTIHRMSESPTDPACLRIPGKSILSFKFTKKFSNIL